jgi:hypothetical protein
MVTVLTDVSPNQLKIPHHGSYVWLALKKKIPLAFNLVVHLFLFSPHPLNHHLHNLEKLLVGEYSLFPVSSFLSFYPILEISPPDDYFLIKERG